MTLASLDLFLVGALSVPFIWLTLRMRVLTWGGGSMAAGIALCVVLTQGWWWLVPLFLFLISGVVLGRLNRTSRTDAKHGRPRDAMQVFCNGGPYALLAVAGDPAVELWMTISLCTAMCDTCASELGMFFRRPTYNIVTGRRVPPGLSGGISWPGTVSGLIASFALGLVMHGWLAAGFGEGSVLGCALSVQGLAKAALLTTAFAMAGMLVDSVLGALLQVKYDDGDGPRDAGSHQISGLRWMTNDVVNLLSNALAVTGAWLTLG